MMLQKTVLLYKTFYVFTSDFLVWFKNTPFSKVCKPNGMPLDSLERSYIEVNNVSKSPMCFFVCLI